VSSPAANRIIAALPLTLLALCVAAAAIAGPDHLAVVLALSAAAAAWMAVQGRVDPRVHVPVRVALAAALVVLAPWYGFFAFTTYFVVDRLPPAWRTPATVVTAVVVGSSQAGGFPGAGTGSLALWAVLVVVNVVIASLLMREEFARERRVDELTELNARLEALQEQLVAQAREAGVLDERARLAREIHDTLAQGLTGIVTQLEAASGGPAGGDAWRRHVDAAMRLARESLTEARRSVDALRPEPLERAPLPDAIANVASSWSEIHGVDARVVVTGDARPLRPELEVVLLRTAQEALANVSRHARASRVGVTLSYMEDSLTLDVRDDGVGFTPNGHPSGFGLTAMRQRLRGFAGTLAIESEPDGGTALSATVPALSTEDRP